MLGLRNISISRRLWLILLTSILMLLVLAGLMLKQSHDDLYAANQHSEINCLSFASPTHHSRL